MNEGGRDSFAIGGPSGPGGFGRRRLGKLTFLFDLAILYGMSKLTFHDDQLHAHFVTFSCYRRRRLLDHDRAKRILLGVLNSQLASRDATCVGFVVMPDHVHAIVWFSRSRAS